MIDKSRARVLIELLTERTSEDRVEWVETDYADTYIADFEQYTIQLTTVQVPSTGLGKYDPHSGRFTPPRKPLVLEIRDSSGRLIQTLGLTDNDMDSPLSPALAGALATALSDAARYVDKDLAQPLRELYQAINRQFDEPNAIIEDLIKQLE